MHLMHAQFPIFSIAGSYNVHYNLKTSLTFHVTSYNSTAVREREKEVKTEEELFEGREGQREVWK